MSGLGSGVIGAIFRRFIIQYQGALIIECHAIVLELFINGTVLSPAWRTNKLG